MTTSTGIASAPDPAFDRASDPSLGLHLCRTPSELDAALDRALRALLPDTDFAMALATGVDGDLGVRIARGERWRPGQVLTSANIGSAPTTAPVRYRDHELGRLLLASSVAEQDMDRVGSLVDHYGAALANLTFGAEQRNACADYSASLQVFEAGIVLFQEQCGDAVHARLLALAATMAHSQAGALFVLERAGDASSALRLQHTLGMPEALVERMTAAHAGWTSALLAQDVARIRRSDDPTLGGLPPDAVPDVVRELVALPLRYDGIDSGLIVLFNPEGDDTHYGKDRLQTFCRLGAALLHRFHIEEVTARQRMLQKELQVAAAIQQRLLPTAAPEVRGLEFDWHSLSANKIGGDYLDLLPTGGGDLSAIIADAAGHGIDSALLMSSLRSTWRAEAGRQTPEALCRHLNREVCDHVGSTGMFITAATLRIDRDASRLTVASAGHNPLLLFRQADGDVVGIEAQGPPLGFCSDLDLTSTSMPVSPGDVLLLYTDGITEACDADGEMFGEERLAELLRRHAVAGPRRLRQAILDALETFTGRQRQEDDTSLSIVKVTAR